MTWTYFQSIGELYHDADFVAKGYSGQPGCTDQTVHDKGPIPVGTYQIGRPHDTDTHGPYVLRLTPDPSNQMFGRDGFLIHGDSRSHPGYASNGCIIFPLNIREVIVDSGDTELEVVP